MSRKSVPNWLRELVFERAQWRCEYCLLHQDDSFAGHNVDHIIARKHSDISSAENLALACAECNRYKGSDIGTIDPQDGELVRLFDPRRDLWAEHFELVGARIEGKTAIGRGTARLLQLNEPMRVKLRALLQEQNRYPKGEI